MDTHLPESAYKYFWDINPAELDVAAHPRYVIERLLEYGDFPEIRWLFGRFSRDEIVGVLRSSRRFSRLRASAWANYFEIPREGILCLSKSYLNRRAATWPY
ncbi:MAG: hypothetical protein ABIL11_02445 [Chloroflexota bacterium]